MLRPPRPLASLADLPDGRLELRKLNSQGLSFPGGARHAVDLHRQAQRMLVIHAPADRADVAIRVLTPDGRVHRALPSEKQTEAFRDAFYAARKVESERILDARDRWLHATGALSARAAVDPAPSFADPPAPPLYTQTESPLDGMNVFAIQDAGWPLAELAEPSAPPSTRAKRKHRSPVPALPSTERTPRA